jgi:hypothetical protein
VFSEEQAWDVLADIPNDSAAALVLLEHHWAVRLRDASSRPTASVSVMGSSARWISSRSACSPAPRRRSNTPSRQHRPARVDPVGPERTVAQRGGRHVRITQGRAAYSSTHRPPGRAAPGLSRCPTRPRLRVRRAHPARRKPNPTHLDGPPKPCWVSPICPTSDSVTANRWRHEFTGRLDRRLNRRSAYVQRDSANRTRSAGGGMRGSGTSAHVVRRQAYASGCGACRAEARRVEADAKISAR